MRYFSFPIVVLTNALRLFPEPPKSADEAVLFSFSLVTYENGRYRVIIDWNGLRFYCYVNRSESVINFQTCFGVYRCGLYLKIGSVSF